MPAPICARCGNALTDGEPYLTGYTYFTERLADLGFPDVVVHALACPLPPPGAAVWQGFNMCDLLVCEACPHNATCHGLTFDPADSAIVLGDPTMACAVCSCSSFAGILGDNPQGS